MTNRLGHLPDTAKRATDAERDWAALHPNAREVLGQLFLQGPLYDGHVASKVGRDHLMDLELIERGSGFQWLTRLGFEVAMCADVPTWFDGRWTKKQGCA